MNTSKTGKVHILYLVSRLQRHGPIFQLYNIIKCLDRKKFYPRIVTLSPECCESYLPAFEEINVECNSLGLSRIAGLVLGPRKIKRILNERPVDLIHIFDYRSVFLCANHSFGIPRIATCRQSYRHIFGLMLGYTMMKTFLTACGKCECVVAVSNSIRNLIKNRISHRIEVIHNGTDRDKFRPVGEEEKRHLRSQLGLPQHKCIVVSVGFLSKIKDPFTIIKAFLNSKLRESDVLVLLGDGPLREKCSRLTAGNDNVRIVGFVENVKDYLGAADVFVSASLAEGCPNAVMESLACGLPVILSDIAPHREILSFNEQAGLLFATKDIASLSKLLSKIKEMNYSQRSSAALSIIKNHLNANNMSLEYQCLYEKLLQGEH